MKCVMRPSRLMNVFSGEALDCTEEILVFFGISLVL